MKKSLKTIKELKLFLENLPDDSEIFLWDVGIGGTVYSADFSYTTKQCIEHSGKKHSKTGLIIEIGD